MLTAVLWVLRQVNGKAHLLRSQHDGKKRTRFSTDDEQSLEGSALQCAPTCTRYAATTGTHRAVLRTPLGHVRLGRRARARGVQRWIAPSDGITPSAADSALVVMVPSSPNFERDRRKLSDSMLSMMSS